MKTDLDNVALACQRNNVDERTTANILSDLQQAAKEEAAEREANKQTQKKQKYCIVVSDTLGSLRDIEVSGFAVTIDEDQSEFSIPEKLTEAAREYNRSDKGRKNPVNTVGEALEVIPVKLLKEYGITPKNREIAYILPIEQLFPQTTQKKRK